MKAIVCSRYGPPDALALHEVALPTPRANEVRVKIHATTVTTGDCEIRKFKIPALFWLPLRIILGVAKPRRGIFGQEYAGEVDAVGTLITKYKKGNAVFGPTTIQLGAHAEYICLPEVYLTPFNVALMSYEEAATIPTGGINGLHFVRKAKIRPGETVLINGAGGSIGTYALQFAKSAGAIVTCVDAGIKLNMLRELGADQVIDYTKEDFTEGRKIYDVIIDIVGNSAFSKCIKLLKAHGRYVLGNPSPMGMLRGLWTSVTSDKEVISQLAAYTDESREYVRDSIATGRIKVVIDKRYSLEAVPEAHRYVEAGLKAGNVAISVTQNVKQN
jgi:NADPH:quinone reductase-like Zn-dependent oxidoreductase